MVPEPPRDLTTEEAILIGWLATSSQTSHEEYASQIEGLKVVGHCECGCGSIDLEVSDSLRSNLSHRGIIADYIGWTEDRRLFGVMLWARHGLLELLEIVIYDGAGPISTPRPEMLNTGDPFST